MHHHAAQVSYPSKTRVQKWIVLSIVVVGSANAHGNKANQIRVGIVFSILFMSAIITVAFYGHNMLLYHAHSRCIATKTRRLCSLQLRVLAWTMECGLLS